MNEEINKIIDSLEGCIGMFDYMITPIESNLLVSYIRELQQENKQLKDNWNELKEYTQEKYDNPSWASCGARYVLEKMQELKGSDSNE